MRVWFYIIGLRTIIYDKFVIKIRNEKVWDNRSGTRLIDIDASIADLNLLNLQ